MRRDREAKRTRRLTAEERPRLLAACGPHLRALVEAALESGCCLGELLGLTWAMVDFDKRMIVLPASLTKMSQSRAVPITPRLDAILRMRQHDPAGKAHAPEKFVFGDELGRPVASIKTSWGTAVRKACIADLRFHDLRREAASTLVERGLPLHYVSKLLGHANIATTSIYLSASNTDLRKAFDELERREREAAERLAAQEKKAKEATPEPSAPEPAAPTPISASVTVN
jgi:integrase